MSRAQSAISLGGSVSGSKKHTVPLSAAGDYLTQEDEYARLNAELEARTAILLQDAESVLRHNEELLAEGDNQDHGGDFPLNEAVEGMQYDDDVENKVAGFGDKYEYLPSEEEDKFDLGLEEQLTGIKTSVPEIKSTVNQRAKSAKGGEKMLNSRPGSKKFTERAKSQPFAASGRQSAAGSRAEPKSKAEFVATPSEAAASALKKTIARIESEDSGSADTPSAIDVNPDIGVASELGSEAANRFLKAKLRVLQEEMDRLAHESNKKDQENYKLQQRLKETEDERTKLQKASQTHLSQIEKMKKMLDESKRKADSAESQMTVLKKELEAVKRDTSKQTSGKSVTEVRLNRALEEVEKYKTQLAKLNQNSKETMESERKRMDQLVAENKKLEKQKVELIAGFKKQLKLIDLLKRQKMHLEAAKLLHFTEEEFIKALDLDVMENTAGLKLLQEGYEGVALTKIFPAKGFYPSTAGGAWYTAKLVEEENRLQLGKKERERVTYSRLKKQRIREAKKQRLYEKGEDILAETQSETDERATHLDGFYLLRLHGVNNPNDLSAVDISGKPLETANDEDLELFDNVIYVNAGETLLRLETFNHFSSLQELEAPLCALKGIRVNLNDFEYLQILDLSYNNLTPEDVGALSILPKLRALYLTGNGLTQLPTNLCSNVLFKSDESASDATEVEAFPCLEVLHLDSNEFENPETLALLAGLKQLKSLNLDNNSLPAIPYIKIAHGKPIERYHVNEFEFGNEENEDLQDNDMNIDDVLSSVTDGLDLASKMTTSNEGNEPETVESDNNKATDSKVDALSDDALNVPGNSIVEPTAGASAECVSDSDNDTRPPPPPFPELRYFSIAHNKISSEDGVLPVVGWPMLLEINLIGNPIVGTYKGEPPLINRYLTQRLGITVKRFTVPFKEKGVIDNGEIVQATNKPPTHRTVKEVVPPMKRRPIDFMAIEYPGIFDPLPSRDVTPSYGDRAKVAIEEDVIFPPNNLPPEMRPISTQQPLPPIKEESKMRPKSGPEDYHHMRKAPPELNRFSTEDVLFTNTNDATERRTKPNMPIDENEPFFLTQVNEDGEKEFVDMSEEPVELGEMKPKRYIKKVPKRLKPFQLLYQTDADEDKYSMSLPKDVHSNVKALNYALKHPLTLNEGVKHEQALMHLYQPDKYRRAAKPKIMRKTKTELFYDTLSDLRNRVGYIETNLEKVLAESNMKKVNEVAVLVSEIQEKYKQSTDKF